MQGDLAPDNEEPSMPGKSFLSQAGMLWLLLAN
jgi:hypothetical protein